MTLGIASNSKIYTAVLMLKLQEENVLKLDDSIKKWLPTYKNINPNITIRQLLNHTSGITDPFTSAGLLDTVQKYPTKVYTPEEVLAYVGLPNNAPGVAMFYSNINYILAAMVAKSATGKQASLLMREKLLNPLNLDSTFFDIDETIPNIIAHRWYNGVDIYTTSRISLNTSGGAAGAIFTTVSELAQFYDALMSGRIINQKSLTEMKSYPTTRKYGLGTEMQPFLVMILGGMVALHLATKVD